MLHAATHGVKDLESWSPEVEAQFPNVIVPMHVSRFPSTNVQQPHACAVAVRQKLRTPSAQAKPLPTAPPESHAGSGVRATARPLDV